MDVSRRKSKPVQPFKSSPPKVVKQESATTITFIRQSTLMMEYFKLELAMILPDIIEAKN